MFLTVIGIQSKTKECCPRKSALIATLGARNRYSQRSLLLNAIPPLIHLIIQP